MNINNYAAVDRQNRPNVLQRVALVTNFINDGVYTDPYLVSAVTIYRQTDSDTSTLIASNGMLSATPLMNFAGNLNASNYSPGTQASAIYKLATGQYAVILDGTVSLSGVWIGSPIRNQASAVGNYVDIWTVQYTQGSNADLVINEFSLFDDTFLAITEPLLIKTYNKLITQKVYLGSKIDLKILTDIYVENRTIDDTIKNLFKDTLLTSATVQITKINEDRNLASRVIVSSFTDTSSTRVSPDNTIIFNFDTTVLAGLVNTIGNQRGEYRIQARYTVLNELIYSPEFSILVL